MNNKARTIVGFLLALVALATGAMPLAGATSQKITFKGGYTKAVMKEGRESIILTQGAVVQVGEIVFEAETIELSGKDSRYLTGTEKVRIVDSGRGLTIEATSLTYDRELELILIDGWVDILDLENEVIASGAYLSYDQALGIMKLQIAAKLLHHTESGAMVCRADSISYDRANMTLALKGNSSIYWKGDVYESSSI
ncbi:MAG: hypothetical protein CVV52_13315, partial [Spirochaetae bacterium HGW-Spirochaetae-8]